MFIASLILYLISIFSLVSLFYFLSSDTYHILLHIAPHLLLPTLLFFTFFHVLLLVYCGMTGLSLLLTLYPLIYIFLSFNIKSPSICYSSPHSTFTFTLFILSTTLTIFLFLPLAIIFSIISTSSPSITTSDKLQIHCSLISV